MDENTFWELVEEAGKSENAEAYMTNVLEGKTIKEIIDFDSYLSDYAMKIHENNDIWQELNKNGVYASSDGYYDFAAWMVARGKKAYEEVMEDPKKVIQYTGKPEYAPGEGGIYYLGDDIGEKKIEKIKTGNIEDKSIKKEHSIRLKVLLEKNF